MIYVFDCLAPSLGIGWSQAMNASAESEASKLSCEDGNDDDDDDKKGEKEDEEY